MCRILLVSCCCSSSSLTLCQTLCNPRDCSMPSFPVAHHLLKLVQTHVYWGSDPIQPSHPLPSPSPPAFNLSSIRVFLLMNQLFSSGSQSVGASASASVLPMNIQDWFPLGLTSLISLSLKGLSKVFSKTTVEKHHLFGAQLSLWPNSHIYTWLLKNHSFD